MLGEANTDRISVRRAAVVLEILAASWALAGRDGLTGFSLRDVAKAMSMQPPSLYSYVSSKNHLYDLMFQQAHAEVLALLDTGDRHGLDRLRTGVRLVFRYCVDQPARFTLMFLRTVPGFQPSAEAYAGAEELYRRLVDALGELGVKDQEALDVFTALLTGLMSQQIANDPQGDRWERLLDSALDMFLAVHVPARRRRP